jgi:putative acetyltransferase
MITLRVDKPNRREVIGLVAELDKYLQSLYPPESNYLLDIHTLMREDILFVTAKEGERYIGCGAVKMVKEGQYGEIKRMYVVPDERGKRIGYMILAELERLARQAGFQILKLETGIYQRQAISLYEKFGFQRTARFGEYKDDPLCLFFEKHIEATVES